MDWKTKNTYILENSKTAYEWITLSFLYIVKNGKNSAIMLLFTTSLLSCIIGNLFSYLSLL